MTGRWSTRLALAVGVLASVVLGAGVLALLSDTVIVEDNEIALSETETRMDLQVADRRQGRCDEFSDGPIAGRFALVDAALFDGQFVTLPSFCLANRSGAAGTPTVRVTNVASLEQGPCQPDEALFGDTTCGDGDPGEFVLVPSVEMTPIIDDPGCGFSQLLGETEGSGSIGRGAVCHVQLFLQWDGDLDELDLVLAQTDVLQYDLEFTLVDPDNQLPDPADL